MSPAIQIPEGARPVGEAFAFGKQGIFERGDHVYLQTPVQRFRPSDDQIEAFAFSAQLKSQAPNENLVWFKGQYVEADSPNANGATWRAEELGIKSLTPMLMPVTVMHDPRTAVGTIADVKLVTPEKDKVPRARIDTVLALWGHRFPEAVAEAEINADQGTLMQSMECYSPWYECSACGEAFHKLPGGAEEAGWCEHLIASNPSAGFSDRSASPYGSGPYAGPGAQSPNASRILGDVCFTGTGLIFGTRGVRGAYKEANLENFAEVLAAHHQSVHTATSDTTRSASMGVVQIEQSELDLLRKERDDARAERDAEKTKRETAEAAAETAEQAKVAAEGERDTAKADATQKDEELAKAALKDKRLTGLGEGFRAKLDSMPTVKSRLETQAADMTDEDWEARVTELEEVTSIKRDAAKDGDEGKGDGAAGSGGGESQAAEGETFGREALAKLDLGGNGGQPAATGEPSPVERGAVVGSLAGAFKS